MAARHYSPQISRFLVCALYHEAKRRRLPMTKLADELLERALLSSPGYAIAAASFSPDAPSVSEFTVVKGDLREAA